MMNSTNSKGILIALMILFFLPLVMMGDSRAGSDEQMNASASGPARVFPEVPITVNDDSLDGALNIYPSFVLDCWEIGCRPCQLIEPKIDQMAKDFSGRIVFGKLCIDRNPITMDRYGVSRTPTLLIFENGTLVYKQVGNYPQEELENIILTVLHMR
jgi:thioredoxin-like negative regulator of GroEL